jgi:tripartite-type tricarboxylate transporter receptor subunit TctC
VIVLAPIVQKNLRYDPDKDLVPVSKFVFVSYALVMHPSVPATSMKELVAVAKARPGQLNYASGGTGSLPHLAGELLKISAGIDMLHVPYRASALAVTDLVGGHVQLRFAGITSVLSLIEAGKLRGIAVTAIDRSPLLPHVRTANESGFSEFNGVGGWVGLLAPARTPMPIIQRLHEGVATVVNSAEMKRFLLGQGADPALEGPEQFAASIRQERSKWAKVIKAANLTLE